ncbi:MAG: hypothetical protein JWN63_3549 [Candidatus Acidoferrum typicum]|nr:hypothetical protein [Candidatus Acidoferrum typicum]
MPPSTTPGSPSAASAQFFANGLGLRRPLNPTRHSHLPHHPLPMGESFRGFPGSLFATACRFACLPGGSDRALPQPTETFTPKLSTGRSPFPLSGITTVVTEQAPPAGLAPTGMSTSIAALGVDSKPLTSSLSSLDATYKKPGGGAPLLRPLGNQTVADSRCLQRAYCGLEDAARLWSSAVRSNSALARSRAFISLYNFPN